MIRIDAEAVEEAAPPTGGRSESVVLAHGGGGQLTDELIGSHVLPKLGNEVLNQLLDSAILSVRGPGGAGQLAMTIDSYVVQPWKFPGGDIGRLAVSGTVNDLAVSGAKPLGLALGMILAEGFSLADLDTVIESVSSTAREAGVKVVTGDTKVVGRGQADGIYLVTAGIGKIAGSRHVGPGHVQPGDQLIVNGPIGEHGLAVMLARELPNVKSIVKSDVAPLNTLIDAAFTAGGRAVHFLRDATRGGIAGLCADMARQASKRIILEEMAIEVRPEARHAAEMLGLDPLEIANEGKVVIAVAPGRAQRVLHALQSHPLGKKAAIIGHVEALPEGQLGLCELHTSIGGRRIVQKPYGEQLPRIC